MGRAVSRRPPLGERWNWAPWFRGSGQRWEGGCSAAGGLWGRLERPAGEHWLGARSCPSPAGPRAAGAPGCQEHRPAAGRGGGCWWAPRLKSMPGSCRRLGPFCCHLVPRPRPPGRVPPGPGLFSSWSPLPGPRPPRQPPPPPPLPPRAGRSLRSGAPASRAPSGPRARFRATLPWRCREPLHGLPWPHRCRRGRWRLAAEPSTSRPSSSSLWSEPAVERGKDLSFCEDQGTRGLGARGLGTSGLRAWGQGLRAWTRAGGPAGSGLGDRRLGIWQCREPSASGGRLAQGQGGLGGAAFRPRPRVGVLFRNQEGVTWSVRGLSTSGLFCAWGWSGCKGRRVVNSLRSGAEAWGRGPHVLGCRGTTSTAWDKRPHWGGGCT